MATSPSPQPRTTNPKQYRTVEEIRYYLYFVVKTFEREPADDDYQLGYLHAMQEIGKFVNKE